MEKKSSFIFSEIQLAFFFCWETVDNPEMGSVSFGNPSLKRQGFEVSANVTSPQVFE